MMRLDSIMTTDVITISVDDNLELAREIMRDQRIRHLPVVDSENKLVGLITTTNVLAATDSFLRDDDSKLPVTAIGPIPGTMVLVGIFLVAFIVYYFVNWKLLSDVWQVG